MNNYKISYEVLDNSNYVSAKEYYAGTVTPNSVININIQIWNNKYGTEDIDNLENGKLVLLFDNLDDSFLLNYIKVQINNGYFIEPIISCNKGYVDLNKTLYGTKNNGLDSETNNYININLRISEVSENVKNNLKSLYINIEN